MIASEQSAAKRAFAVPERASQALPRGIMAVFWALLVVYALARVLTVFPDRVPMLAIIALHVVLPLVAALIHGSILYRLRGALVFALMFLIVGNIFENLSVATGFPFGHYYFTQVMGPKLFQVPILLGLAYLGMGYMSWTLALLIFGETRIRLAGASVVTVPLVASFIMVAWDFSTDPVWSTLVRCWIWRDGGPYFGVPVSNFLGWYLTVYIFYQLFALYVGRSSIHPAALPSRFWRVPVLFYAVCAAGNVLLALPSHGGSMVADPSGTQWKVSDITAASAVAAIFTMGTFALMAWIKTSKTDLSRIRST